MLWKTTLLTMAMSLAIIWESNSQTINNKGIFNVGEDTIHISNISFDPSHDEVDIRPDNGEQKIHVKKTSWDSVQNHLEVIFKDSINPGQIGSHTIFFINGEGLNSLENKAASITVRTKEPKLKTIFQFSESGNIAFQSHQPPLKIPVILWRNNTTKSWQTEFWVRGENFYFDQNGDNPQQVVQFTDPEITGKIGRRDAKGNYQIQLTLSKKVSPGIKHFFLQNRDGTENHQAFLFNLRPKADQTYTGFTPIKFPKIKPYPYDDNRLELQCAFPYFIEKIYLADRGKITETADGSYVDIIGRTQSSVIFNLIYFDSFRKYDIRIKNYHRSDTDHLGSKIHPNGEEPFVENGGVAPNFGRITLYDKKDINYDEKYPISSEINIDGWDSGTIELTKVDDKNLSLNMRYSKELSTTLLHFRENQPRLDARYSGTYEFPLQNGRKVRGEILIVEVPELVDVIWEKPKLFEEEIYRDLTDRQKLENQKTVFLVNEPNQKYRVKLKFKKDYPLMLEKPENVWIFGRQNDLPTVKKENGYYIYEIDLPSNLTPQMPIQLEYRLPSARFDLTEPRSIDYGKIENFTKPVVEEGLFFVQIGSEEPIDLVSLRNQVLPARINYQHKTIRFFTKKNSFKRGTQYLTITAYLYRFGSTSNPRGSWSLPVKLEENAEMPPVDIVFSKDDFPVTVRQWDQIRFQIVFTGNKYTPKVQTDLQTNLIGLRNSGSYKWFVGINAPFTNTVMRDNKDENGIRNWVWTPLGTGFNIGWDFRKRVDGRDRGIDAGLAFLFSTTASLVEDKYFGFNPNLYGELNLLEVLNSESNNVSIPIRLGAGITFEFENNGRYANPTIMFQIGIRFEREQQKDGSEGSN